MKRIIRFIVIGFISLTLIVLPYIVYSLYMLKDDKYTEKITWVVYHAIKKGKQKANKAKKLIFGDSVADQLYYIDSYDDSIYSMATNQAIGIIGQYMLLKNFSEHNSLSGEKIYLVLNPLAFKDNLNQKFTFSYFLKPFYNKQFKAEINNVALQQIKKIPLYWASQLPVIKTSNWSVSLNSPLDFEDTAAYYISDVSLSYLKKMKNLAQSAGATMKVVSPFLNEKRRNYDSRRMQTQIKENGLQDIFQGYFANMKYLPDSLFVDDYHLNKKKYHISYNPLSL